METFPAPTAWKFLEELQLYTKARIKRLPIYQTAALSVLERNKVEGTWFDVRPLEESDPSYQKIVHDKYYVMSGPLKTWWIYTNELEFLKKPCFIVIKRKHA